MPMQWPQRSGGLHHRALDHDAAADELPQRNEQLARKGNNRRLLAAALVLLDALLEPAAQRRGRLVPQPQPSELDHGAAQSRIARLGDALFVIDGSALP